MSATSVRLPLPATLQAFIGLRDALGGQPPASVQEAYARAARCYAPLHWCWLRLAGGSAERALLAAIAAHAPAHGDVLDAGCGTGRFSARVLDVRPDLRM